MKFNPDLIQKARKGEIAILNDGSVEELFKLLKHIWPMDYPPSGEGCTYRYFKSVGDVWTATQDTALPTHSVKDFFMPDTKDTPIFRKENEGHQPRTYRVTRQQMKEIHEISDSSTRVYIIECVKIYFHLLSDDTELPEEAIKKLIDFLGEDPILKRVFPEYFFIPEGEPVLVRRDNSEKWRVRISNGRGGAYQEGFFEGAMTDWSNIIPFTKNPPK